MSRREKAPAELSIRTYRNFTKFLEDGTECVFIPLEQWVKIEAKLERIKMLIEKCPKEVCRENVMVGVDWEVLEWLNELRKVVMEE